MIEIKEYKGKNILTLKDESRKFCRISFGVNKARLIITNIEAITQFLRDNEKPKEDGAHE